MNKNKTVIIITGPTAPGKTALALEFARYYNTAVISADSRQCFRELNIGVAKPAAEELNEIKHYFIDSHSIHDTVTAQTFEAYALEACGKIFSISDIAIMAGGTGLYIKAFCEGFDEIPAVDPAIREAIKKNYEKFGFNWLQNEVSSKDPVFWEVSEQHNPQRLMRALEVLFSTGRSVYSFRQGNKRQRDFNIVKIGINISRERLYENINARVDKMIADGLLEEAKSLLPYKDLNALQTVGYRELFEYYSGFADIETTIEQIKKNTGKYAKRQLTWFKKDKEILWFHQMKSSEIINEFLSSFNI